MMKNIKDVSLDEAKNWSNAAYMPEGLVLTDCITDAPIPQEPRRMNYILMALCRRGRAQYSIDTRELKVEPGDLLFNRTNSMELVGKTGIYKGEQPAIYAGYLVRVTPLLLLPERDLQALDLEFTEEPYAEVWKKMAETGFAVTVVPLHKNI